MMIIFLMKLFCQQSYMKISAVFLCNWTINFNYKVSEYDQEMPRSHTADQPMPPQERATEH